MGRLEQLMIECFERTPGRIAIRAGHGGLVVYPTASNVVSVECEDKPVKKTRKKTRKK